MKEGSGSAHSTTMELDQLHRKIVQEKQGEKLAVKGNHIGFMPAFNIAKISVVPLFVIRKNGQVQEA